MTYEAGSYAATWALAHSLASLADAFRLVYSGHVTHVLALTV